MELHSIFNKMGIAEKNAVISAFKSEEDGQEYAVWKVYSEGKYFVLKEAKEYEYEIYNSVLKDIDAHVPRIYKSVEAGGKKYLLMEYIEGETLFDIDKKKLTLALDALIYIGKAFWEKNEFDGCGLSFGEACERRKARGKYLFDEKLEAVYGEYLKRFSSIPKTFCHDDLLPFNIIVSDTKATIIDWETGGMLPYPTSLSRFIAHTEDDKDAFFRMSESDKEFAIEYYYENFIKEKGISYEDYIHDMKLFVFYEYCEWIMLGNKYKDADMDRFKKYSDKAKKLAHDLQFGLL